MKPRSLSEIIEMNEKRKIKSWNWKGGQSKDSAGYICIYYPEHPSLKGKKTKTIRKSRLIMEAELKRYIGTYEYIHHKNGIITDDRIENLDIMTPEQHQRIHHVGSITTEETKQKISIAQLGEKNHMYGKKLTDEHKQKISHANKIFVKNRMRDAGGKFIKSNIPMLKLNPSLQQKDIWGK